MGLAPNAWMSEWSRRQIQDLLAKAAWVQVPFHAIAYYNFFIITLTTFNIWQGYTDVKICWVAQDSKVSGVMAWMSEWSRSTP